MLYAAIDIGSNTTRVLVAEPSDGQLRKVMEQRAYTRIGKASQHNGAVDAEKVAEVAVVDVGGGSSEVVLGSAGEGLRSVQSFKIGSGGLADDFLSNDPPSPAELRAVREHIAEFFDGIEFEQPDQAVAVGGSATSLRALVGAALEY